MKKERKLKFSKLKISRLNNLKVIIGGGQVGTIGNQSMDGGTEGTGGSCQRTEH